MSSVFGWLRSGCIAAMWVGLSACTSIAPVDRDASLASLVAAERAFAAMSAASGIRAAFAANFAADGIAFEPGPVDASHAFFSRPEPPNAKPRALDWAPAAAGIAASGDFGFTTGPFALTDRASGRSLRDGVYFSVWRRDANGRWRVALDAGIVAPAAIASSALMPSPVIAHAPADATSGRAAIAAIESRPVDAADYARWFAVDGRLHRDGFAPFVGSDDVGSHLASAKGTTLAFGAQGDAIAASGDLAYTYGALTVTPSEPGAGVSSGYFAHLWARDASGRWRLVVAVLMPGR